MLTFLKHTQVVLIAAYQASQNHIYLEQLEENQKENQWVALESCDYFVAEKLLARILKVYSSKAGQRTKIGERVKLIKG